MCSDCSHVKQSLSYNADPSQLRTAGATYDIFRKATSTEPDQYNHYCSLLDVDIRDLDQYCILCPSKQTQDCKKVAIIISYHCYI